MDYFLIWWDFIWFLWFYFRRELIIFWPWLSLKTSEASECRLPQGLVLQAVIKNSRPESSWVRWWITTAFLRKRYQKVVLFITVVTHEGGMRPNHSLLNSIICFYLILVVFVVFYSSVQQPCLQSLVAQSLWRVWDVGDHVNDIVWTFVTDTNVLTRVGIGDQNCQNHRIL